MIHTGIITDQLTTRYQKETQKEHHIAKKQAVRIKHLNLQRKYGTIMTKYQKFQIKSVKTIKK